MHVGKEMESSGDVRLGFLHGGSVYVFARLENEVFDHCVGQSFSAPLCQLAGQCPSCLLPVISASLDDYGSLCHHPGQRGRSKKDRMCLLPKLRELWLYWLVLPLSIPFLGSISALQQLFCQLSFFVAFEQGQVV